MDNNSRTSHHRQLAGNILALYVLQGLNYVVPMAVLPYLVRVLGMETYGLIAFAQSFAQYFTLLTDYGFNFSATRSIAQNQENKDAVSKIVSSVLVIKLVLLSIGAAILIIVLAAVTRFSHSASFFVVAYLAVIGNVLFPVWYFQGIERMKYISVIVGAARLGGAIPLFLLVHSPKDGLLALTIQSLTVVASGIAGLCLVLFRFAVRVKMPTRRELYDVFRDGLHLFISTASISLYTNTNVFLVGIIAGNREAGYFSAAEKLVRAMQGLLAPITQALFPRMSALVGVSRELALRFAVHALKWMGGISLAASIAILIMARTITVILFGNHVQETVPIVRWLAFLPFLIAASNVLAIQMMIPFKLDKQLSGILLMAGMCNIAMAIPLIHLFAARGAGISVLCTETFVTMATLYVVRRNVLRPTSMEIVGL